MLISSAFSTKHLEEKIFVQLRNILLKKGSRKGTRNAPQKAMKNNYNSDYFFKQRNYDIRGEEWIEEECLLRALSSNISSATKTWVGPRDILYIRVRE